MITIPIPRGFDLHRTINSHGWHDLPPFSANEPLTELTTVISLTSLSHFSVTVKAKKERLVIDVHGTRSPHTGERRHIIQVVRSMLRMDDDLKEFYALCRTIPHLRWVPRRAAGRILRSPTVFEDVVKMLFTTNCSWGLTKIQTTHLVNKLGPRVSDNIHAFPSPEAIASKSERWLRRELSCGYRAPYLLSLCRSIADERIELESLRNSPAPTDELYSTLRSIKGIGHYAAGNILKLLGRYDHLGIDSWVRSRFAELHRQGRPVKKDDIIERHYDRYGRWRGLVCLMEVTADWHT